MKESIQVALMLFGMISAVVAQTADPSGAAYWFTPAIPGLVATDLCTGQPFNGGRCKFQTNRLGISFSPGNEDQQLSPDAGGWIYLAEVNESDAPIIDTCVLDRNGSTSLHDVQEWPIYRVSPSGVTELVGVFTEHCEPPGQNAVFRDVAQFGALGLDVVNGTLYVSVRFNRCSSATSCESPGPNQIGPERIVQISGLPTLLDVIPEGPPGSEGDPGPPGPPGPPGTSADESRVAALEQLTVAQQAQIEALQATLEQIENLPTIKKLMEKVQELEEATP